MCTGWLQSAPHVLQAMAVILIFVSVKATWVYAIQSTSLAHAMLFISVTPVLLAVGALVLRQPISAGQKSFK